MDKFTKVVRIGTTAGRYSIYCKIEWTGSKLSISGVEGPLPSGNARGACGQIDMHLTPADIKNFAPGWTRAKFTEFLRIWKRWHLNDMCAGSPAQRDYLRNNPPQYVYPETHYDAALRLLASAGLQPDASYAHNGKPYSYGSAWLHEDVPGECLEFLRALPDTDKTPAWV